MVIYWWFQNTAESGIVACIPMSKFLEKIAAESSIEDKIQEKKSTTAPKAAPRDTDIAPGNVKRFILGVVSLGLVIAIGLGVVLWGRVGESFYLGEWEANLNETEKQEGVAGVYYVFEEGAVIQKVVSEAAGLRADARVKLEYITLEEKKHEVRLQLKSLEVEKIEVTLSQNFEQVAGSSTAEIEERYMQTFKNGLERQKSGVENQEMVIDKAQDDQIAISSPFTGDTLLKRKAEG